MKEYIPKSIPKPLGKCVTTSHYVYVNLHHDLVTGKVLAVILPLVNSTPVEWFSKKQGTVKMATYGSEFAAARIAVDQVKKISYVSWIPNQIKEIHVWRQQSLVTSSTIPSSATSKSHHLASSHRVQEVIPAGIWHSPARMARQIKVISSANIANLAQFGPCSNSSFSGMEKLQKPHNSKRGVKQFIPNQLQMATRLDKRLVYCWWFFSKCDLRALSWDMQLNL